MPGMSPLKRKGPSPGELKKKISRAPEIGPGHEGRNSSLGGGGETYLDGGTLTRINNTRRNRRGKKGSSLQTSERRKTHHASLPVKKKKDCPVFEMNLTKKKGGKALPPFLKER